ncbi:glycosyltransferase involved in cell wall biosynthesis [Streptosporangium becharense]|uniref:Glycosyltransferase involved in cell wall biosynthesis n=1 Tax=Streptosporangium becharense TaxID=1816182 RepID=A0A7W9MJC2_9ACTN|nr:glycosyltransferase family 2 protein [Streptosporangium becharense]MBB2910152.1 glycosyltransferase involved in cell wall biosynthesis [Streptosporangium becharense]MBB5822895.1 glycosyltransferase involved in cell wall biosynthesis [Streptosporangium becharense]
MIKLSVVVPVRDAELYISDALTSLVRNARRDFEFIVVDDGSVDATGQIIEDFRDDLPGLVVLRNETPVGLADARNLGLSLASGRYLTFMDGDDWLAPGYLADLLGAIERLSCDFVRVDHVQAEGRRRVIHRAPLAIRDTVLKPRDHILPARSKTMVDYPYAWAGVYHRDLGDLLTFPGHLHTAEDRPWIWRLHRQAASFAVVSLAGLFYRRMVAGSLTQIGDARQLHFFDAFDLVFADLEEEFTPKAVRMFCALLAHHLELRDRFSPELRTRFEERGAAALRRLPADVLAETRLDPERDEILRRLLEAR